MNKNFSTLFILVSVLFLSSCGSKKNTTYKPKVENPVATSENSNIYKNVGEVKKAPKNLSITESYIYQYADIAQQEMRVYGIPASIKLAQGILESANGQGNLTSRSNNHFGIKCNGWKGAKVYHDDDEDQECFRKYSHAEYSYRDHSLFLYNRNRYAFLFSYKTTDYKSWAKGLKKAGYATDPKYPDKLIGIIERYELYKYDEIVSVTKTQKPIQKNEKTYTVKKGDTLYSISTKYNIDLEKLKKINKIKGNIISVGQTLKLQ